MATFEHFTSNRPMAVVFGDSITQQGFITENSGWVGLLADYWTRKVDVINRGYSGYNTRLGLNMVREVVCPLKPSFVTVFFGANDASVEGTLHHVPLNDFVSNMEGIISILKKDLPAATIVLITPPPVYEPTLTAMNIKKGKAIINDRNQANTKRYVDAVKAVGERHSLSVIDVFALLKGEDPSGAREEFLSDGLHLNSKGNVALYEAFVDEITTAHPQWDAAKMEMDRPGWSDALMALK